MLPVDSLGWIGSEGGIFLEDYFWILFPCEVVLFACPLLRVGGFGLYADCPTGGMGSGGGIFQGFPF